METDRPLLDSKGDAFALWIRNIKSTYTLLSSENRNILLENLIANSEPNQMEFLDTHLPPLICRDFISRLSLEHVTMILKHLSGKEILRCCWVCKNWRDRIYSLTDVWQTKAFQVGVNVQAVSKRYSDYNDMAKIFRTSYCLAERFLSDLKEEAVSMDVLEEAHFKGDAIITKIYFTDDSIIFATTAERTVRIFSVAESRFTHTVPIHFSLLPCYKHSLVFTRDRDYNVFSWNVIANSKLASDSSLFCDRDTDIKEETKENTKRSMHRFVGHKGTVCAIDVAIKMNGTFVITASVDGAIKLWKVHNSTKRAELLTTLKAVDIDHRRPGYEVHFLPNSEHRILKFISCGISNMLVWSFDLKTKLEEHSSPPLIADTDLITGFYFETSKPGDVFIVHKETIDSVTMFTSYRVCQESVGFDVIKQWTLPTKKLLEILGVGTRFAFFISHHSYQDFYLFDLITGTFSVTFTTTHQFRALPVKMYNKRWLDGFVFEKHNGMPILLGPTNRNKMGSLDLRFPLLDFFVRDD